jgi:hypothetical protein
MVLLLRQITTEFYTVSRNITGLLKIKVNCMIFGRLILKFIATVTREGSSEMQVFKIKS